jgi:hypothetical protein
MVQKFGSNDQLINTPPPARRQRARQPSPLRQVRADAILDAIACEEYGMYFERSTYRQFEADGFTRQEVQQALDDLAESGEIELFTDGGVVVAQRLRRPKAEAQDGKPAEPGEGAA